MLKSLMGGHHPLNCLVKANRDGEKAYRAAAAIAPDEQIKDEMIRRAEQRGKFADQLAAEVRESGAEPATGGSLLGKVLIPMKMAWLRVRGADRAVLATHAVKGEECALAAYSKAMKSGQLEGSAREIVQRQMSSIARSRDELKGIQEHAAPGEPVPES